MRGGVAPGDEVIALNRIKAGADLPERVARLTPGEDATLHIFRRDELHEVTATVQAAPCDTVVLTLESEPHESASQLLDQWLGEVSSTPTAPPT